MSIICTQDDSHFKDYENISSWAIDAVNKVCSANLMKGREDSTFAPMDNTKRAEAFTVIYRLLYN